MLRIEASGFAFAGASSRTSEVSDGTADQLGTDEPRHRARGDAGKGVAEHPADRDGRVREARRAREEVGRADVGRYRDRDRRDLLRAREQEDHEHEARGRDDLGQQVGGGRSLGRAPRDRRLLEHEVGEDGSRDAPEDLGREVPQQHARRPMPEGDVDQRDHRVEVCPAESEEDDDEYAEAEDGGEGVDQQRQSGVGGELLGGGTGADDDGREQAAPQELRARASQVVGDRGRSRRDQELRDGVERTRHQAVVRPGAPLGSGQESGVDKDLQVMGHRRLAQPDRVGEVADARLLALGRGDDRDESETRRVGECLQAVRERSRLVGIHRLAGQRGAAGSRLGDGEEFERWHRASIALH